MLDVKWLPVKAVYILTSFLYETNVTAGVTLINCDHKMCLQQVESVLVEMKTCNWSLV
jgi:hypothetical protein